jgi:hypothetical protein
MNYPTYLKPFFTFYKRKVYTQRGRVGRIVTSIFRKPKRNEILPK